MLNYISKLSILSFTSKDLFYFSQNSIFIKIFYFKGALDKIAALCYADAPNASTHMDHTR